MSDIVKYERRGNVGIMSINNPPVNALGAAVRKGLVDALDAGLQDKEAQALVLICEGRTFIAGADITEFDKPLEGPDYNTVLNTMEAAEKPIVAAIHGTALGGGLETALSCHYRIAVPKARVGLPEVNLGIIPGAGGTQRLPRLIGVEAALEIIAGGNPIPAPKAAGLGLVDHIVEGDLLEGALAFAQGLIDENKGPRRCSEMEDKIQNVPAEVFEGTRKFIAQKRRGFNSPQAAIDAVEAATQNSFADGLKKEGEIFMNCLTSTQSAAQRHIFFAERAASKIPDIPKDTPILDIKSGAVIGAGTMGGGIAMNFANAGIPVYLIETDQEALDRGVTIITKNYASGVKKGRMTQEKMDAIMGLITPTLSYDDIKDVDIVIEAVFEEMDIKKEVFGKLDAVCKPECILATNTSTLDVDAIAEITSRPEQVIGLHFFSPANIMKLLEIVRGAKTSKEVIATSFKLAKAMRKVAVLVGVCYGFVGNRMVFQYGRQAEFLLEEGALPQQVDKAIYDFGMAMGPFAMNDLAGLDIGWRIRKRQAADRDPNERYAAISDKICEMGRFGQKTGAGYYKYEGRIPSPDPEIDALVIAESEAKGMERREISDEEIIERCIYALINEGAKILEEGIALRSSDIDVIYIYGYGFPVYRGGPMHYADAVGLDKVYAKVAEFHATHGEIWEPAPLLKKLAEEGGTFGGYKG